MGHSSSWSADAKGFIVKPGCVQNAIHNSETQGIRHHFVLIDEDGPDNAVLDAQLSACIDQLQACGHLVFRLAIMAKRPARNERAMTNDNSRKTIPELETKSGYEQAVKNKLRSALGFVVVQS